MYKNVTEFHNGLFDNSKSKDAVEGFTRKCEGRNPMTKESVMDGFVKAATGKPPSLEPKPKRPVDTVDRFVAALKE
ncbi:MAG: hypothetical protein SWH78_04320 [Thermodesulfobacteriota bacterium]|nr:hypothetical protein [Thermodesulfobacteriota bacterium]